MGRPTDPLIPEGTAPALRAWVTLRRAATACTEALEADFTAWGLTESQFGVLEALRFKGPMHPCDLARTILRTSGNLTLVLDQLERRGLVRRERAASDRRFITVHLTDEGLALIDSCFPVHARRIAELFAVLSPEDLVRFSDLNRTVGRHAAGAAATT